jgi:hypothetical protein
VIRALAVLAYLLACAVMVAAAPLWAALLAICCWGVAVLVLFPKDVSVNGDKLIRVAAGVSVVAVAGIATVISYNHAHELVLHHGETGRTAAALPLTVDGLIATCSLVLLACARSGRRAPWHTWVLLAAGVVATIAANVAHGMAHGLVGAIVAGWPALVAVGSFDLLIRLVRDGREDPPQWEPVAAEYVTSAPVRRACSQPPSDGRV